MIRLAVPVAAIALAVMAAPVAAEEMLIATEGDYPPWNDRDRDGAFIGFEPELVAALCEIMEAGCDLVVERWPVLLDRVAGGTYAAGISGIAITPERAEQVLFTRPYASLAMSFAVAAEGPLGTAGPATRDEAAALLDGRAIGVQEGTVTAALVEAFVPGASIVTFETTPEVADAVLLGTVDAGLASTTSWDRPGLVPFGPALTGADSPLLASGVGIALPPGTAERKAAFDEAICRLAADGTIGRLSMEWFGEDLTLPCLP